MEAGVGGGCALASDGGTVDGLGSELLNLLLIVSFLLAVSRGSPLRSQVDVMFPEAADTISSRV